MNGIYREDTWRGRLQAKLDQMAHGVVIMRTSAGHGWTRVHVDGFQRHYESKPPAPRYTCVQCHREGMATSPSKPCWWCVGDNRLTSRQRLYLAQVKRLHTLDPEMRIAHCDDKVLHAPGTCWACDLPPYQKLREMRLAMGILFSDEPPRQGWDPCPSTAWRPASTINRWGGNRAEAIRARAGSLLGW